jgi:hypothetical protein
MKSLTLSLLVAFGLTLGAANAFAETPHSPVSITAAAQEALKEAQAHDRLASQYRMTARIETKKAQDSMAIAINDDKYGFTYEAGVQRAKAEGHLLAARTATNAAAREDAAAAQCRSRAAQFSAPPSTSIKIIVPTSR